MAEENHADKQASKEQKTEKKKEFRSNFVHDIIDGHCQSGRFAGRVHTRFPPEPNGYLHIGHSKAICLNFLTAQKYGGKCNLRFDDTNPLREEVEYIDAIKEDIKWLGFEWDNLLYASSYFDQLYDFAVELIRRHKAYVCSLDGDELRNYRGNLTTPGKNSPDRDRSVQENLDLFTRMKAGEFKDGEYVLRAKIDMSSGNMNMRDPLIYRIRHTNHPMTGDKWCIYPLYDFTHGLSDSMEQITHSICTLEFADHRPLYDWILQTLERESHPQQIEFAKLKLNYVVLSKRYLREMVEQNIVSSWDDPRMPTLKGFRRRGYTAKAIRDLCEMVGVTKSDSIVDMGVLEECLRQDLNQVALRKMAVLDPIKVILTNYPADKEEILSAPNHPQNPELGRRELPFSNELYIERDDFLEDPPKKFFRLKPGGEVRLRNSYVIKCEEVFKDDAGKITKLHCSIDPETLGKKPDGRKVKGIIHWVSAKHALSAEVRLYDRLFTVPNPLGEKEKTYKDFLNPDSLQVISAAFVEPSLKGAAKETSYQFERLGYFAVDNKDSRDDKLVFNRAVTLRDTWAKINN